MSKKSPSYIASLILSVKWHKLLNEKKEDIVHYRAKLIRLENEGLTLFWNHHDKDFAGIYVEKGDYILEASAQDISIDSSEANDWKERVKFYLHPYNAFVEFLVITTTELAKYNMKIPTKLTVASLENFKNYVLKNYNDAHWFFSDKRGGKNKFGEKDISFKTFQECNFQTTDHGIALDHEFITVHFSYVQLSDKVFA